jgi:16S rRNA (guanine966-N2)-methyltransferase
VASLSPSTPHVPHAAGCSSVVGASLTIIALHVSSAAAAFVPVRAPRRLRKGEDAHRRDGGKRAQQGGTRSPRGKAAIAARPQGKSEQVRELQRLYVTGGSARGRKITTPSVYMRPMMARVREAVFSMLYPTGVLRASAHHLDLFSGSGVVGLEALSRGVGDATFVDFSSKCAETIRSNADSLGFSERTRVIEARVDSVLLEPSRFGIDAPFDLVSITPPYEEVVYAELVEQLAHSDVIGEDSLVAIEYPVELGCFPPTLANGRLIGLRNRRYGRTVIGLYVNNPSGKLDVPPFSEEFVSV